MVVVYCSWCMRCGGWMAPAVGIGLHGGPQRDSALAFEVCAGVSHMRACAVEGVQGRGARLVGGTGLV